MTVRVGPTEEYRPIDSNRWAAAAKHGTGDWIVPPDEQVYATADPDLLNGPYNAAAYNENASSGLTVRINTVEAFVGGHYVASDDATLTETDPITGDTNAIHDAELQANTANQTVYLGVDHQRGDRIIIGTEADFFTAADPRVALYDFTTDDTGVTDTTDRRPVGRRVDLRNDAYDAQSPRSDADIRPVAIAKEVQNIDLDTSNLARTDEAETFEEPTYYHGFGYTSFAGVPGRSNEAQHFAGANGDLLVCVQRGHGRVAYTWNAYWDVADDTWRTIVADEPHALIALNGTTPGPGTNQGNVTLAAAPANAGPDGAVNWQTVHVDETGTFVVGGVDDSTIRFESPTGVTWEVGSIVTEEGTTGSGEVFSIQADNGTGIRIDYSDGDITAENPDGQTTRIVSTSDY
jgi:hypothetical protein